MAVIGSIRKRGTLLLLVIGFAMVAFILGDIFSNRGGGAQDRSVGSIAGEEIDVQAYERRVQNLADAYSTEFSQTVDAAQMEQLRNQVWSQMIRERVVLTQAQAAGIQLHKEEYDDVRFGNNMLDDFKNDPNLKDPNTGQVDKARLVEQFNQIQEVAPIYYKIQKRNVIDSRTYQKYMNLIKGSMYVTKAEAAQDFKARGAQANFQFVLKEFSSVPDSTYTPSDAELRTYYNAHKNDKKYAQKASRAIEYVKFPITPTAEDELAARDYVAGIKADFIKAEDDSSFVARESDTRTYAANPYTKGSLPQPFDSLIMNADTGAVIGPYKQGTTYALGKVVELRDFEEATVRHILIKNGKDARSPDDETAKALADSILRAIKRNGSVFEDLVAKYSEDVGSVANGGKYESFPRGQMVKPFEAVSFDRPVGTKEIAKTSFGYHVMEVLGQETTKQRILATITRDIEPSGSTNTAVYKKANTISLQYASADSFRIASERVGGVWGEVKQLTSAQQSIPGIPGSSSLVSEAFRMDEIGALTEPKAVDDNYVILRLIRIREEGVPAFEDMKEAITPLVIQEKKAKDFVAQMANTTDLNALAGAVATNVKSATGVNMASGTITGGYNESEVIGKIFNLANGETGGPFIGDQGVYVVQMTSLTGANDKEDYSVEKENLMTQVSSNAENLIFNALREAAGVTDDRKKFY